MQQLHTPKCVTVVYCRWPRTEAEHIDQCSRLVEKIDSLNNVGQSTSIVAHFEGDPDDTMWTKLSSSDDHFLDTCSVSSALVTPQWIAVVADVYRVVGGYDETRQMLRIDVVVRWGRLLEDERTMEGHESSGHGRSVVDTDRNIFASEVRLDQPLYGRSSFHHVVLGGTFDHLHAGHKVLLSLALYVCAGHLVVAVTGESMLRNKKYANEMQSFDDRKASVLSFLETLMQGWEATKRCSIEVVELNDAFGPSVSRSEMQAVVFTPETLTNGSKINPLRRERGFADVQYVLAPLVLGNTGEKISSTNMRALSASRHVHDAADRT